MGGCEQRIMSTIFYIGIAMVAGLIATRLTKLVRLPNVTAYLLAGILIGPYVLNLLGEGTLDTLGIITEVALGFIAFSIGDEFKLSSLKTIGGSALIITLFESTGAVLFVMTITLLMGFDPAICIVLGALSASTAPAATLLIVRQYRASGPLTSMLLPVVAADDATGLIAYSVCISIATGIIHNQAFSFYTTIMLPLIHVLISLAAGAFIGLLLALTHRFFRSRGNRLSFILAAVFIGCAAAKYFELSSLLLCMAIGAFYVNLSDEAEKMLGFVDDWTYALFMLFFVISGAELNFETLPKVGLIGIVYVIARFAGKYFGAFLGGTLTKQPPVVRKNIGWALMPQAGVAIGMATMALSQLPPEYGRQIQTVILGATFIYEIAGPISAKTALKRAGEIEG